MDSIEVDIWSSTATLTTFPDKPTVVPLKGANTPSIPSWKKTAAQKRSQQAQLIPLEWRLPPANLLPRNTDEFLHSSGLLTPDEVNITELSSTALLQNLASSQLTAVQVARAFCKRAAFAQQLINCCTEILFDEALTRAQALDEHLEQTGRVVGLLHGLPVSLKDIFDIQGRDSTIGWVALIDKPAKENSVLAASLLAQGAVLYVKTNVAQALMLSDSYNHIFKQSLNSLNRDLISGGSSGGEGALIAAHGSIIGVGTDTGGSVRIPAALQGLYGLKPTGGRVPFDESRKWEFIAPPVAGPIASDLSTIELFMEGLLSSEPWHLDPSLLPIPWRKELAAKPSRPLKVGYFTNDGVVRVQPPNKNAVLKVVSKLKAAGHTVVEWDASDHGDAYQQWVKVTFGDGGESCRELSAASGEPLIEGVLIGTAEDKLSIDETREAASLKAEFERSYLKRWRDTGIDVLITPVQPYVGMRPRKWAASKPYIGYTSHWNWLDYAALTIPVVPLNITGTPDDEEHGEGDWATYVPKNESDRLNYEQYDPKLTAGMPVGVQVVAPKYGEEMCVAVAKVIKDILEQA
ncbi:amidase [Cadophora sp. DSE1049]|nr:amidase [Cadophora sp. DSE1049]